MLADVMEDQRRGFVNHSVSGHQNICISKEDAPTFVIETWLGSRPTKKREAPTKIADMVATAYEKRMFH